MNTGYTHLFLQWHSSKLFERHALQKPGQLQHVLNRANIISALLFFFTQFLIHAAAEITFFFFLQSRVKSPKRVSLEHGFMEEANRLIPLGHELIKSKTWGQIRPRSGSGDECGSTVCSDKRMIKIKAGHTAPNTQLWWQREASGQRERRKALWGGPGRPPLSQQSLFSLPGCDTVHLAYPGEECHPFTVHRCTVLFTSKL